MRNSLAVAMSAALLAGCAGAPVATQVDDSKRDRLLAGHTADMQRVLADLYDHGEWNAVLNLGRLGYVALQQGDLPTAATALDMAILRVEAVYADSESAKAARSVWSKEAIKDFKGEPYERTMLYYYRGLVDLAEGDFENARAMFRSAEYQDTLSEAETYQADFALMNWMSGWASHCAGDSVSADEAFGMAKTQMEARAAEAEFQWAASMIAANGAVKPAADAKRLLLFEFGRGPVKYSGGESNELLMFNPGAVQTNYQFAVGDDPATLNFDARTDGWMAESLTFQATTRGGRPIDSVLAGKANFKEGAETVGEVATGIGTAALYAGAFSGNDDLMGAGAAIALIGLFSSAMAEAADPDADKRAIGLPEWLGAGVAPVQGRLFARAVGTTEVAALDPVMFKDAGKCSVEIYRDPMALAAPLNSEFVLNPLTERELRKLEKKNRARDASFRNEIAGTFERYVEPAPEPAEESPLSELGTTDTGSPQ